MQRNFGVQIFNRAIASKQKHFQNVVRKSLYVKADSLSVKFHDRHVPQENHQSFSLLFCDTSLFRLSKKKNVIRNFMLGAIIFFRQFWAIKKIVFHVFITH